MNLCIFTILVCLILTQFFNSVLSALTENSKSLNLSGTSNKYASPQLYVFGGYDGEKSLSSASHFNSSTGRWKSTTDMEINKGHSCGVAIGTKIYLFGGGAIGGGWLKTAEVYNCETGTYSQFRSMETGRGGCAAAALDGFIYVAGGWDGLDRLSSVIRYNIQTTRLEDVTPMLTKRNGLQLVEFGKRLYAIGGQNTKTVEMFNPATNQWKNVASTQFEHKHFGATAHEGGIYVCSQAGCEMYSPVIDQWTPFASSPNNIYGSKLVSMNHKLWSLGGGIADNNIGIRSVSKYDTFAERWSQQPDMDVPRKYHTLFVVNHD